MGKSRLLPGGVPAPFPFLPQVVFGGRRVLSPRQVRKLVYEAPGCAGPTAEGSREGRVCLRLRVFSLQTRPWPKRSILYLVGLPRNQAAAERRRAPGVGRPGASSARRPPERGPLPAGVPSAPQPGPARPRRTWVPQVRDGTPWPLRPGGSELSQKRSPWRRSRRLPEPGPQSLTEPCSWPHVEPYLKGQRTRGGVGDRVPAT